MAGDSLKHPDILTPLILLDLPLSAALDTVIAAKSRRPKIGQSVLAADKKLIADPIVEKAIRERIQKPKGELTKADLEKVRHLSLSGTKITDAGLKEVAKLQKLTTLGLNATQVTKAGVAQLKKALPKCAIGSNPKK